MTFPRWGPLPPIDEEDESEWSSETESESDDDQSQSEVSEVLDCDDSDTNSALFDALFTPSSKPWADFEDENDVQWPEEWSLSDSECGNHPGWSLPLSRIRAV
jgi:hypothetical protein